MKNLLFSFCIITCSNVYSRTVFISDVNVFNAINTMRPDSLSDQYLDTSLVCKKNISQTEIENALNLKGVQHLNSLY